jgi:hypothetical protein
MTNLRKSFILLSAAITMGNLERAQAAAKNDAQPAEAKQGAADAKQAGQQERVSKKAKASRRAPERDFNLGMPAGSAYDVVSSSDLG